EIFVMRLGEILAPGAGFSEGGWFFGDAIGRWKRSPAASNQIFVLGGSGCHFVWPHGYYFIAAKPMLVDMMPCPCSVTHLNVRVNVEPHHSIFAFAIRYFDTRVVMTILLYTMLLFGLRPQGRSYYEKFFSKANNEPRCLGIFAITRLENRLQQRLQNVP